jgi:hypothetical protein
MHGRIASFDQLASAVVGFEYVIHSAKLFMLASVHKHCADINHGQASAVPHNAV